jgi:hypothetical protein
MEYNSILRNVNFAARRRGGRDDENVRGVADIVASVTLFAPRKPSTVSTGEHERHAGLLIVSALPFRLGSCARIVQWRRACFAKRATSCDQTPQRLSPTLEDGARCSGELPDRRYGEMAAVARRQLLQTGNRLMRAVVFNPVAHNGPIAGSDSWIHSRNWRRANLIACIAPSAASCRAA